MKCFSKKVIIIIIALLAIGITSLVLMKNAKADEVAYGEMNIEAINTGSMQLKGVTWCKKYFKECVYLEKWSGPILREKKTTLPQNFVVMQTGITNPTIVEVDDVGGGKLRIIFVYDQTTKHEKSVLMTDD